MLVRRLGGRQDVEDAAQTVFMVAWQKRDKVPDDPAPWLFTVARYVSKNMGRRNTSKRFYELGIEAEQDMPTVRAHYPSEAASAFSDKILKALSKKELEVMLLKYNDDLGYPEIAAWLDITEDAARQRVSRAQKRLREHLDKHRMPGEADNDH